MCAQADRLGSWFKSLSERSIPHNDLACLIKKSYPETIDGLYEWEKKSQQAGEEYLRTVLSTVVLIQLNIQVGLLYVGDIT